jgi:hypothetical protein
MSSESPQALKKKLPFAYKSLKPNEDDDIEFQFEELRAKHYFWMHERKTFKENQMEQEIKKLKEKIAEIEVLNNNKRLNTNEPTTFKEISSKKKTSCDIASKTVNDNNFTNITLMSSFHKTKSNDETVDIDESTNWLTTKQFGQSMLSTTNVLPTSKVSLSLSQS